MGKLTDYTGPPIRPRGHHTQLTISVRIPTEDLLHTSPTNEAQRLAGVAAERSMGDGAAAVTGLLSTAITCAVRGDEREAGHLIAALGHVIREHAITTALADVYGGGK